MWDEAVSQWTLKTRGGELASDYVIAALPFEAMGKLLTGLPPNAAAEELGRKIAQHEHWPICSVHLWFDREITELEHAVLLDREIHWMYNQSRLQRREGNYIELVVSATRAFAALPREQAIAQAARRAGGVLPARERCKAGEGRAGQRGQSDVRGAPA